MQSVDKNRFVPCDAVNWLKSLSVLVAVGLFHCSNDFCWNEWLVLEDELVTVCYGYQVCVYVVGLVVDAKCCLK